MLVKREIHTNKEGLLDITEDVKEALEKYPYQCGMVLISCPHTTAALTINEGYDPAVAEDLLLALDRAFPDRPEFKHLEGNSAAHMKASILGSSLSLAVEDTRLVLGRWQRIFFCEFDPPRRRNYFIKFI